MPLLETKGAGSAQGFGLSIGGEEAVYIEDVFSTYLYTGTGASLPIVNGIDLDAEGGLVWTKSRSDSSFHKWYDSARGISFAIESNTSDANQTEVTGITSFNSNGYTYGTDGNTNSSGTNYVSWTFRKQPKFFDIVTYTGTGSNRTIAHNLGSVPGCIMVKKTSGAASDWNVYHRSIGNTFRVLLNSTSAAVDVSDVVWNATTPTATVFSLGTNSGVNSSGDTYVAYLFAHDAGGFGLTGTDNVISCGTFTTDADGFATVNLGYEPQWVMVKKSDSTGNWIIFDNMRGWSNDQAQLNPNTSGAEGVGGPLQIIQATGFATKAFSFSGNSSNIYIAIRRGPMEVPTSGTSVFTPLTYTGSSTEGTLRTAGFTVDAVFSLARSAETNKSIYDRLRGAARILLTNATDEEAAQTATTIGLFSFASNVGYLGGEDQGSATINFSPRTYVNYLFRRAPGFFDEVCYTGTGANRTVAHNLAAVPELMIVKDRTTSWNWIVSGSLIGAANYLVLNGPNAQTTNAQFFNNTNPTSSVFSLGTQITTNGSGDNYVAYLFATLAGVSKVGSYTGTGTTLQINCGFTGGARFVLIKRTDSTGDWYVWDSARGIVAGNDPYLLLNSTAAEVTSTDYVDTASTGFEISSTAPAAINANGGSFIFFAVA